MTTTMPRHWDSPPRTWIIRRIDHEQVGDAATAGKHRRDASEKGRLDPRYMRAPRPHELSLIFRFSSAYITDFGLA